MSGKFFIKTIVLAALIATTATSAFAFNPGNMSKNLSRRSNAPAQYVSFCRSNPSECRTGSTGVIPYTNKYRSVLASINRKVNNSMRGRNEGRDIWSVNTRAGDCEDFALTKRSQLIRSGIPAGALRLAMVITRRGIGHAVLVVKTTSGDYVLDNLRSQIVRREQSGYGFIKVATANPMRWGR